MFWIIVYDISDDRRRTRLYDQLRNFGTPVQKSVFEFAIGDRQMRVLRRRLRKLIAPGDRVLCLRICQRDRDQIWLRGPGTVTEVPQSRIL